MVFFLLCFFIASRAKRARIYCFERVERSERGYTPGTEQFDDGFRGDRALNDDLAVALRETGLRRPSLGSTEETYIQFNIIQYTVALDADIQ